MLIKLLSVLNYAFVRSVSGCRITFSILIGSRQQLSKVNVPHSMIGDSDISLAAKARNLGIILDSTLSLNHHVSSIVRSAYRSKNLL